MSTRPRPQSAFRASFDVSRPRFEHLPMLEHRVHACDAVASARIVSILVGGAVYSNQAVHSQATLKPTVKVRIM